MVSRVNESQESVSIRELNHGASAVINRVHETGEPVVITNHGKPWVRIVPVEEGQSVYDRLLREGRIKPARKTTPPAVSPVKIAHRSGDVLRDLREDRF